MDGLLLADNKEGGFTVNLKEKLTNLFGGIGYIFYLIINFLFPLFAIVMIVNSFTLPSWVIFVFVALLFISPSFFSICFLVVGLIATIMGPQDVLAIIYYIVFVLKFAPSIILLVISFFEK